MVLDMVILLKVVVYNMLDSEIHLKLAGRLLKSCDRKPRRVMDDATPLPTLTNCLVEGTLGASALMLCVLGGYG